MHRALLDLPWPVAGATALSYVEPHPLDSVDLLLWNPGALAHLFPAEAATPGGPGAALGANDAHRLVRATRLWRDAMEALLQRGGTIALFLPAQPTLSLHTVQDVVSHDLLAALPAALAWQRTPLPAQAVACRAGEPFHRFFAHHAAQLQACVALQGHGNQVIAHGALDALPCAAYRYLHPGRLLLLPALRPGTVHADGAALVNGVAEMVARLRSAEALPSVRTRASRTPSAEVAALRAQLEVAAARRRALQEEEAELRQSLQLREQVELLLADDESAALGAAARALHALGAYVQLGAAPQDGLLFELNSRYGAVLAVEAKPGQEHGHLAQRVAAAAAQWERDLHAPVQPVALLVGEPFPDRAAFAIDTLRRSHPVLQWWRGRDLLAAYDAKDATLLSAALSGGPGDPIRPTQLR